LQPPAGLRRLLQAQNGSDGEGSAGGPSGTPPASDRNSTADGGQVPVILGVTPGLSAAVAVNASSGRIIDAAGVNTTRCIRYADGYSAGNATLGPSGRPPLNLTACRSSRTVVASATQQIVVQASASPIHHATRTPCSGPVGCQGEALPRRRCLLWLCRGGGDEDSL
jgi:hypothetical protein